MAKNKKNKEAKGQNKKNNTPTDDHTTTDVDATR